MSEPREDRARARERSEPDELHNPVPWPLALFSVALVAWGAWYYFQNIGYPLAAGDRRTPIVVDPSAAVDGSVVYAANCVACHQADGNGLAGVFPPLAGADWVTGSEERLVQILLHGIQGPIEVSGMTYNGVMPAFPQLTDGELAAVLTHIRASWGNEAPPVGADVIAAGRERFPERSQPWQGGSELMETFGSP